MALALIEDGQVVLGVLGCPNLPMGSEAGALLAGVRGERARAGSLWNSQGPGQEIRVSGVTDPSGARFCESVESAHSSHGDAQKKLPGYWGLIPNRFGWIARPSTRR